MDIIGSGGKTQTTTLQRLFWCVLEALVTIILLIAGGLAALKAATIIAALPFAHRHARPHLRVVQGHEGGHGAV